MVVSGPRRALVRGRPASSARSCAGSLLQGGTSPLRNEAPSCRLDGATTERLRHAVLSGITGSARTYARFRVGRFLDHPIEAGVATAAQPPAKKLTPLDRLREEYETYPRRQRGLAESTIKNCTGYMERFLAFRFGDKLGDLNAITPPKPLIAKEVR